MSGPPGLSRRRLTAGLLGSVGASVAQPAASSTAKPAPAAGERLETLSWAEAEAVLRDGRVAVVPIGARCKEHGLHLPLNTDWLMAEYLAERLVRECAIVLLPTIPYGYYPTFVEYPGSVNIRREAFRDTIEDIAQSLARHGVRRIYFLNTGISTNWALEPARLRLAAAGIVIEYTDLLTATAQVEARLRQQSAGTHADELETSLLLHMAPAVVHMERARPDIHPERGPGPLSRNPQTQTGVYSPTGAWGDPTLATRKKGEILTEALIAHIKQFLLKFANNQYQIVPPRERYLIKR